MTIESGVRRIIVGVDGSAESVAALRWACREASLRAAEVLAVLALESRVIRSRAMLSRRRDRQAAAGDQPVTC